MKTIFSSNSDVAHNYATLDQHYGSTSNRNYFFEHNKIYSYGYHYLLGTKFEINNLDHIVINDYGYSVSTSKHISILRSATSHFKQFNLTRIELKPVYKQIKEYYLKIPRATKNKGFYIDQIQMIYSHFVSVQDYIKKHKSKKTILNKYIIDQRCKEFKELTHIYNNLQDNLLEFEKEIIEINKKLALKKKKENDIAIYKFRNHKIDYCRTGFDVLRIDSMSDRQKTGQISDFYVRSGQGINMSIEDSLKGIEMIKKYVSYTKNTKENDQNFIRGQKIGAYTVISFINNLLTIGCHRIKLTEILNIENKINQRKKYTK